MWLVYIGLRVTCRRIRLIRAWSDVRWVFEIKLLLLYVLSFDYNINYVDVIVDFDWLLLVFERRVVGGGWSDIGFVWYFAWARVRAPRVWLNVIA